MIKLNCGVSREVGEPNHGSCGASVNVELELESSAIQDAELLHEKIRRLFALAKASVDEELGLDVRPRTAAAAPADEKDRGEASFVEGDPFDPAACRLLDLPHVFHAVVRRVASPAIFQPNPLHSAAA